MLAAEEMQKLIKRDWAVSVLDRWARRPSAISWGVVLTDAPAESCWMCSAAWDEGTTARHYGPTPNAARIAAAEALFAEDPTLDVAACEPV